MINSNYQRIKEEVAKDVKLEEKFDFFKENEKINALELLVMIM